MPPKPSPAVIGLCKAILGPVLRLVYDIRQVSVRSDDLEALKSHTSERMVLVPNHPSHGDPAVLFKLSRDARENWFYLSNREQFDRWFGLYGRLLQRCGAYSIARGTLDAESFVTTRRLLVDAPNKLVVFAEGGNYSWNDVEAPFQEGLFRLLLKTTEEMKTKHIDGPLWIQPVAIKYVFGRNTGRLEQISLTRLEMAVGLEGTPPPQFRDRVLRIGSKIVEQVERNFFGRNYAHEDLAPRILRVREEMLHRFAQALGTSTPAPETGTVLERTRVLFDQFHRVNLEGVLPKTEYEETLFEGDMQSRQAIRLLLERLENWAALRDGYLDDTSRSRRIEILSRLEREVFRMVYLRPTRKCELRLCEPFDLTTLGVEGETPKEVARKATREAEARMKALLDSMRVDD